MIKVVDTGEAVYFGILKEATPNKITLAKPVRVYHNPRMGQIVTENPLLFSIENSMEFDRNRILFYHDANEDARSIYTQVLKADSTRNTPSQTIH